MSDLKPLGSERLQGMDKIQRILEISKFNERIPQPINETSKNEYKITLADGNEYQIVKEKTGYIIKKTLNEGSTDYMEPMKNRKYFSSYSQALKKLNLMAKEFNALNENVDGISLFSEQKKFVLKTPKSEKKNTEPEVENVPPPPMPAAPAAPTGMDTPPPPPPAATTGEELPPPPSAPTGGEEGGEDLPPPPTEDEMEMGGLPTPPTGGDEEEVKSEKTSFKTIQKLTGRLGQKLRDLDSQGEEMMSSKDIKYVINSILSAINMESLDEDDRDEIISKIEGTEEDFDMEDEELPAEDEMMGDEEELPAEDEMGGEMEESWDTLGKTAAMKTMTKAITPGQFSEGEDEDSSHIKRIADEIFVENKVENILSNYFLMTENEKKFNKKVTQTRKTDTKIKTKNTVNEIKRLSENIHQEIASRRFLEENLSAELIGKTNKKSLVFELGNKQIKITTQGQRL